MPSAIYLSPRVVELSMAYRKWLVRLLVLLVGATAAAGYWAYRRWTDPAAVRQAVLEELAARFPGARIQLDSARMQLFGGLVLRDLQFTRRDDPANEPFAAFPEVVLVHDKEQLAHGELIIRKVQIKGPRFTLVRRPDGSWNLAGILGPPRDDKPFPVIEVQQGALTIRDQTLSDQVWELTGVNLTVVPAEGDLLHFQAAGHCESVGHVELNGTTNWKTGTTTLAGRLPEFLLDAAFVDRVAEYLPKLKEYREVISGVGDLQAELAYHPDSAQRWSYALHLKLQQARLQHSCSPFPVEDMNLVAHCVGGRLTVEKLEGQVAGARVQASGELEALDPNADGRLALQVRDLQVDSQLYDKLPPTLRQLCQDFQLVGPVALPVVELRRREGRLHLRYVVELQGAAITFVDFPYPAENVAGTLAYSEEGDKPLLKVNVSGLASGQPVRIAGEVFGDGLRPEHDLRPGFKLDLSGEGLPIDKTLDDALRVYPESRDVIRQFQLEGTGSFRVELTRRPGLSPSDRPVAKQRYQIVLHDSKLCYNLFPYPVEQVEGTLHLDLPEQTWTLTNFQGRHKGGGFRAAAAARPTPSGPHLKVAIRGANTLLDEEMERALTPSMRDAWNLFKPQGRVDFDARLEFLGESDPDLELLLTARSCRMKPPCFPFALTDVTGTFHYAKDQVKLDKFEARHGKTRITLGDETKEAGNGGKVVVRPGGGYRVELRQLRAEPLAVDQEFLQALPALVRTVFETLAPDQPIRIVTDVTMDSPGPGGRTTYEWDGHVAFANSRVNCGLELSGVTGLIGCRGAHDGARLKASGNIQLDEATLVRQELKNVQGKMEITDAALAIPGLQAEVLGGKIYGPLRIDFGPPLRYQLDLTGSQLDMEKFARRTLDRSGQVRGQAFARLKLAGQGADLSKLRGEGWIKVPDGRLYDLPLILDLLTFLSGRVPKGAAFQEAFAQVSIAGEQMTVSQLTLVGDALSLRGQGQMKIDGRDIDLEMYFLPLGRAMPLLPPVIDRIPPAVSKQLMKVYVQGSLEKANPRIEPVPLLVEPAKEFLELLSGRQQMTERPMAGSGMEGRPSEGRRP